MSGHTPGPWVVESADWWKKDEGVVRYYVRHDPPEIQMMNARLIAAAPDLLAAAKLAAMNFTRIQHADSRDLFDDDHEAWTALDKAIAKAEGGEA